MPNYDFLILQPDEFENLTRDLIQKKEKVFVESFTSGRDGGIDLRFASVLDRRGTIIQAKRYKDLSSLMSKLKDEAEKVKLLNPSRYILSTSVGLTPGNKETICSLFSPYIKSTEDILGRDDLNNLLGQYGGVEKQYYKLWLGSTTVLESIIDKRIENWSSIELETTRKEISLYVMNESFDRANAILKENRYVIISGLPGIGKTTLARMLAYSILANGYEEFIKMNSMDDGAQKLTRDKKQVFFYDDFLGHSYLEDKGEDGFESKVLSFIDKVKREPNKLFILSTREYIFSAAKRRYEGFLYKNIELAKCTLDLSYYSEQIRASILYNHLAAAELPLDYIRALLNGRQYLKLIKHSNFNPRIIESFLNEKLYLSESPQGFVNRFHEFFDHPFSVWDFAFKKMSKLAQQALVVRASMGGDVVYLSDWHDAVEYYLQGVNKRTDYVLDEEEWKDVIKDVLGTFILTEQRGHTTLVGFNNPSVNDYLFDVIRHNSRVQRDLIDYSYFYNQITDTFTDKESGTGSYGRVIISTRNLEQNLAEAFNRHLLTLLSCKLEKGTTYLYRWITNVVKYLNEMISALQSLFRVRGDLLASVVTQDLLENDKYLLSDRMVLLDKIDNNKCSIDLDSLTEKVIAELEWSYDYVNAINLLEKTEKGRKLLSDSDFLEGLETTLNEEIEDATNEFELDIIRDNIGMLSDHVEGFDSEMWNSVVDEAVAGFESSKPEEDDWEPGEYYHETRRGPSDYYEMYSSLLDRG